MSDPNDRKSDPPPSIELSADGDAAAWERYLAQLRSRGANFERYVDEGEVARGGMGAIHRVFDQDARRRLALKVMLDARDPTPAASDASLGRFLEEAQVTSQLDHPGIVPVHEIGVDADDRVYFTMKLVKGEDLRAVFDRVVDPGDEEWTTTRALNVMLRVCEAMAYAHAKGVIHRDLKPGNVMVGKFGEAYVMDWGLAKVLGREDKHDIRPNVDFTEIVRTDWKDAVAAAAEDSPILTMDGAVVGTPAYMPPEQAFGKVDELGPPADVYAVGAMLYHLLAGRMPYTRPDGRISGRTILALVTQGPPPPLAGLAPAAPAELVAIVEKTMAREIDDRYPDMTALARDLRAFLEDRVVSAYETGAWAEAKKWVRRNAALAATAAAAAVLLASLGSWAYLRIRAERNVAIANERAAEAERDRVLRLSDRRRLEVLVGEADEHWPAHPETAAALRDWLVRAGTLLTNLPLHEETLAKVREQGTRTSPAGVPSAAADYDFGADDDARWWHDAARDLVVGLDALTADDVYRPTVAAIEARLAWAITVEEKTTTNPEVAARWAAARAAIAAHPKYGGLALAPQIGLVPLGPDPDSTLWEFGHPRTGDVPARDPQTGKLVIGPETGLVLVLIPGGTYRLGAQATDPDAPHFDPQTDPRESPVHEVTLAPYFLSKYEMTQGEWARLTGSNPSQYHPPSNLVKTLRHPVEQVSWDDCRATLGALGLVLPTEAQWEAACRAGTETPWWTGSARDSLVGAVNLADQAAKRGGAKWAEIEEWPELDDGHAVHAPVGSYRANPFGLHDTLGNLWEWCRDGVGGYADEAPREGDGLRVAEAAFGKSYRGGSFAYHAAKARCATRSGDPPEYRYYFVGVRPARAVE